MVILFSVHSHFEDLPPGGVLVSTLEFEALHITLPPTSTSVPVVRLFGAPPLSLQFFVGIDSTESQDLATLQTRT